MKLHLGCGYKKLEGFVNVDIRPETECDILDDVATLKNFRDNSADMIYACHVLEHFTRTQYMDVLKRWTEILKSDGKTVPSFFFSQFSLFSMIPTF